MNRINEFKNFEKIVSYLNLRFVKEEKINNFQRIFLKIKKKNEIVEKKRREILMERGERRNVLAKHAINLNKKSVNFIIKNIRLLTRNFFNCKMKKKTYCFYKNNEQILKNIIEFIIKKYKSIENKYTYKKLNQIQLLLLNNYFPKKIKNSESRLNKKRNKVTAKAWKSFYKYINLKNLIILTEKNVKKRKI